jgi:glutamine phosphoribosylpyrophosphate amidotransferase
VRGTTSKEIVQMAKDVGARKVIVASCAPPIRYFNSPGYKRFLIGDVKILQRVWD